MNKNKSLGTGLEKRVVEKAKEKRLEASKQPLSGILKEFPSDVVIEDTLAECKVRSAGMNAKGHQTLTIDMVWLHKVQKQAKESGFDHAVLIENAKYSPNPIVLLDLEFFLELLSTRKASNTRTNTDMVNFLIGYQGLHARKEQFGY